MFDVTEIVFHLVVAILIVTPTGTLHEWLHTRKARQLGYEVVHTNYRTNETEVKIEPDDPNVKVIGNAPYYVLFPLGAIIIIVGYIFSILGVIVGGIAILFLHAISFWLEGEDLHEVNDKSESDTEI